MKRQEAERLLAALIFDDLDEGSKAELLGYLQTDDELRERLADMRMAVKVASDTLNHGSEPVLSDQRLKHLAKLAKRHHVRPRIVTFRRFAVAAAVLLVAAALLLPSLHSARMQSRVTSAVVAERLGRLDGGLDGPESLGDADYQIVSTESGSLGLQEMSAKQLAELRQRQEELALEVIELERRRERLAELEVVRELSALSSNAREDSALADYASRRNRSSVRESYDEIVGQAVRSGRSDVMGPDVAVKPDQSVDAYAKDVSSSFYGAHGDQTRGTAVADARKPDLGSVPTPALVPAVRPPSYAVTEPESASISVGRSAGADLAVDADREARPAGPVGVVMSSADEVVAADSLSIVDLPKHIADSTARGGGDQTGATTSLRGATYEYGWRGEITPTRGTTLSTEGATVAGSAPTPAPRMPVSKPASVGTGAAPESRSALGKENHPIEGPVAHEPAIKPSEVDVIESQPTLERREAKPFGYLQDGRAVSQEDSAHTQLWARLEPKDKAGEVSDVPESGSESGPDEHDPGLPAGSRFKVVPVNPWVMSERDRLSTFGLDVDTASYTLCRRYIQKGFLPPVGAVRMEEFVNYFDYQYPQRSVATFAVHAEAAPSPFARAEEDLTLLKIGVKARTLGRDQQKAAHLVFVVDTSASMGQPDRLPLVQQALSALVDQLSPADRVSVITCANESRLHAEAVPASEGQMIRRTINAIQPAGPTNLLAGLRLGYAVARNSFATKQINHVVLCSDGVANVGGTEAQAVLDAVAEDRKQGITITCVGVGYGSYNDVFLEALANRGDGSYMFLDSAQQVRETFVERLSAALQVVARDARIQVQFNPQRIRRYRLIGYENRDIEDARFRDDTVDAGEVGSGQCSTALYELELIGQPSAEVSNDLGTVFVRYRHAETGQMEEVSARLTDAMVQRPTVQDNPRFFLAAGTARFAEILRQSEHSRQTSLTDVLNVVEQVRAALPLDRDVSELAGLIRNAENLPRAP